jgi:hypothetical protein
MPAGHVANPTGKGGWKPGQSGNPKGCPKGKTHASTLALRERLSRKGDSLAFLAETMAASEAPLPLRVSAAVGLLRYQHAPAARVLSRKIDLPAPTTVAEATANIAKIGTLAAARKIGLDEAADLVNVMRAFIESVVATDLEQRMLTIEAALQQANIALPGVTVVGGLPPLSVGPDEPTVILPQLVAPPPNGPRDDGPVLGGNPAAGTDQ